MTVLNFPEEYTKERRSQEEALDKAFRRLVTMVRHDKNFKDVKRAAEKLGYTNVPHEMVYYDERGMEVRILVEIDIQ